MDPEKIYYLSIDKLEGRRDVWKAFPWPSPNLLHPVECLTKEQEEFFLNCYTGDFTRQNWRWELIGPDTYDNILEKAKTYEIPS
jgi:hypothetical protein